MNQTFIKTSFNPRQNDFRMGLHSHPEGQLSFIADGALRLTARGGAWIVPKGRIIWIPPKVRHAFSVSGVSTSWQVLLPAPLTQSLPKRVSILSVSPLLFAALESLIMEQAGQNCQTRIQHLMAVIRDDLERTEARPLGLQIPRSAALRKATDSLLLNPADTRSVGTWARQLGMSRRSFTRHFLRETGSSFAKWQRTLKLQEALEQLLKGHEVSHVALELEYTSVSAFVAAFRKHYGNSPGRFVRDRNFHCGGIATPFHFPTTIECSQI